ncbi:MAG: hypothetical protein HFI31_11780 [Lachnospiraceae bacterium]|jgi:hypothetical protein|nr:hypothetical protein [Lachnospiraceae bacterium]MCI8996017.1 hypothetical protein [Lachnospiraceae bacterium]MCI9134846.1 hypothetical protein [Lachnospiraceae bacterium]
MWDNFLKSLEIMGQGMGGIFVSILVIMAAVWLLAKLTGPQKEEADRK